MEHVPDDELEVGAVHHPCFNLSEKPLARLDPDEEIEAASRVTISMAVGPHERRPTAGVDVPWFAAGIVEVIRQLEVEGGNGDVVAQTDLDIRSEGDPIDQWLGFVIAAEDKLVRIGGGSDADAKVLCCNGSRAQAEKDGEGTQAQQYRAKGWCVHLRKLYRDRSHSDLLTVVVSRSAGRGYHAARDWDRQRGHEGGSHE